MSFCRQVQKIIFFLRFKGRNKLGMKKSIVILTTNLIVLVAMVSSASAQDTRYTSYDDAMAAIGQLQVAADGHTGVGTSIAQIEGSVLEWNFVQDDGISPAYPLFGDCSKPAGANSNMGWVPEGESCQIAWVMCFSSGGDFLKECNLPEKAQTNRNHATTVAKGLISIAPGAKIVAIGMKGSGLHLSYKAAMRWLYTPGNDYQLSYFQAADPQAWKDYWVAEFGAQTPAERFNIVVANVSSTVGRGVYSESCEAINPDIPQTNSDSDRYLDIEDNCLNVHNEYWKDYYLPGGAYIGTWLIQRDTDGDGYGNMCDADLNNDGIVNWVDGVEFMVNRNGTDDPDADFNGDGIVDSTDLNILLDLYDNPPGPAAIDINLAIDDQGLRKPAKYIQDFRYKYGFTRLDLADNYSFVEEIAGLRAHGIALVAAAGNLTLMNAVGSPACTAGAIAVSGIRSDWEDHYPGSTAGSILTSVSPNLTTIVSPSSTIDDPNDENPLPVIGSATSFAAPVVAASIAILKAQDVYAGATVEETIERLRSSGGTAYEYRNCNPGQDVLNQNPSAVPVPEQDPPSIWCPEGTETNTYIVDFTLPLLNLEAAVLDAQLYRLQLLDSDNDGVYDNNDNCIFIANGPDITDLGGNSQRDTNGDGYGNACDADLNNDGIVNWYDGVFFYYMQNNNNPDADFNGDGIVDDLDKAILIATSALNQPPGPSGLNP